MPINTMHQPPTEPRVETAPTLHTPAEQQAHLQHKAQKKQRKRDRLLAFLGWCEGCRSYGNSV